MPKLIFQQSQADYTGVFSMPAFPLWGEGKAILEGLYTAFSGHSVSLADLRNDSSSLNPSDQVIAVNFGLLSTYRFKLDRVEATLYNFTDQDFLEIAGLLRQGDEWLRSAIPDFSFRSHLFSSASHSRLSEGTSRDFLLGLSQFDLAEIGSSEGHGHLFHWKLKERGWQVQMSVDHSLAVANGVFLRFSVSLDGDSLNYEEHLRAGLGLFDRILATLGLEVEKGVPANG